MLFCEVWCLVLELAERTGARDLDQAKGCWHYRLGGFWIALNLHDHGMKNRHHHWTSANTIAVEYRGQRVGTVRKNGGELDQGREEELIAALQAALARLPAQEEEAQCAILAQPTAVRA